MARDLNNQLTVDSINYFIFLGLLFTVSNLFFVTVQVLQAHSNRYLFLFTVPMLVTPSTIKCNVSFHVIGCLTTGIIA